MTSACEVCSVPMRDCCCFFPPVGLCLGCFEEENAEGEEGLLSDVAPEPRVKVPIPISEMPLQWECNWELYDRLFNDPNESYIPLPSDEMCGCEKVSCTS